MALENFCVLTQKFCVSAAPPPFDEFDHRLLALLQADALRTLTELGDTIGLSASAVQRRIKRYRESGLMRMVGVLDIAQLANVTLATVVVALERESARQHAALHARLRAAPEVQQCYSLAGKWDYALLLVASGIAHCREVAAQLFLSDDNVRRYDTMPVFDVVKRGLGIPTRWT